MTLSATPVDVQVQRALDDARSRRSSILWTPGSDPLEAVLGWLVQHVRALRHITHSDIEATVDVAVQALLRDPVGVSLESFDAAFSTLPEPGENWLIPMRDIGPRQAALFLLVALLGELASSGRVDEKWFAAATRRFLELDGGLAPLPADVYPMRVACLLRLAGACGRSSLALGDLRVEVAHRCATAVRLRGDVLDGGSTVATLTAAIESAEGCAAHLLAAALKELAVGKLESAHAGIEERFRVAVRSLLQAAEIRLALGQAEHATYDTVLIIESIERVAYVGCVALSEELQDVSALLGRLPGTMRVRCLTRAPRARRVAHTRLVHRTDLKLATAVKTYDPTGSSMEHAHQATIVEVGLLLKQATASPSDAPWEALLLYQGACEHLDAAVEFRRTHARLTGDARRAWEVQTADLLRRDVGHKITDALRAVDRAAVTLRGGRAPSHQATMASALRLLEATASVLSVLAHARIALDVEQWRILRAVFDRPILPMCSARLVEQLTSAEARLLGAADGTTASLILLEHVEERTACLVRQAEVPGLSRTERLLLSSWSRVLIDMLLMRVETAHTVPPARVLALMDRGGALVHRAEVAWQAALPARTGKLRRTWRSSQPTFGRGSEQRADAVDNTAWYRDHLDEWSRWEALFEQAERSDSAREFLADREESRFQLVCSAPVDEANVIALLGEIPSERYESGGATHFVQRPRDHAQVSRLAAHARANLHAHIAQAIGEGLLDELCVSTAATPERLEEWFVGHPHHAIVVPRVMGLIRPLVVFTLDAESREIRCTDVGVDAADTPDFEPHAAWFSHYEALARDARENSDASSHVLGEALVRLRRAIEPRARELAGVLERAGTRRLVMLMRQPDFIWAPWESAELADGVALGERFPIVWLSTLAQLPRAASPPREGTVQVVGEGRGDDALDWGADALRALAVQIPSTATIGGEEAAEAIRLSSAVARARRLRIFAHGHLDLANPESNRLTLVGARDSEEQLNLRPSDLRRLPLAGMDCVELWACASAGHGRHLTEAGPADEPEDLASAFLVAGARFVVGSRWQVSAWPASLLMEKYALLVASGQDDVGALEVARAAMRSAFAHGGQLRADLLREGTARLRAMVGELTEAAIDHVMKAALRESIQRLRTSWYAELRLPEPAPIAPPADGFEQMVRFVAPAPERRRASVERGSIDGWVDEVVRRFQDPSCWAGWRVVARSLEDLT